jgi:hypothetical protein
VLQVLLKAGAIDEHVIQVHQDELAKVGAEDVVHEGLEGGWGVAEAKGHHLVLVVAEWCPER